MQSRRRGSYDLDQSRQATASVHAGKAAADAEKAAMFKRMNEDLEVEVESMTRKMMKVLSENTEFHNAERLRRAMPEASRPPATDGRQANSNPSEFYDIGGVAGEDEPGWGGQAYEEEEWCYAPAPTRTTKGDSLRLRQYSVRRRIQT